VLPETDGIAKLASGKAANTTQVENNLESGLVIERDDRLSGEKQCSGETQNARDRSRKGRITTLQTATKKRYITYPSSKTTQRWGL